VPAVVPDLPQRVERADEVHVAGAGLQAVRVVDVHVADQVPGGDDRLRQVVLLDVEVE
jgi:hypothetical protein